MERPDILARIRADFELRGDEVYRRRDGNRVDPGGSGRYRQVRVGGRAGRAVLFHRLKFYLEHGWMPEFVDHEDRDSWNDSKGNLRPSTHQQNMFNGRRLLGRELPRGVYTANKSTRYRAAITLHKKQVYLGCFATPAEASAAVEARLRTEHGEFYVAPETH